MGDWTELRDGIARAYRATPSTDQGPGVLVLHAWWGLNEACRETCDRLADAGFVALAPDLHDGAIATTAEDAERLVDGRPMAERQAIVRAALDRLRGEPGVSADGVGVLGFSLGAWYGLDLAREAPSVSALVLLYGTGPADGWSASNAAIQGHFAEDDPFESPEEVAGLADGLRAGGRRVEFHTYPGTRHWFLEPDRPEHDPEAAALAWARILAFLRERLD